MIAPGSDEVPLGLVVCAAMGAATILEPPVHMRALRVSIGLMVVVLSVGVGCRTECAADDVATKDQLAREQKSVLRGHATCRELLTPKLSLVADRLTLTASKEHKVLRRADIAVQKLERLEPYHEGLRRYRINSGR